MGRHQRATPAFLGTVIAVGVLLVALSGCGTVTPAATLALPPTSTPIPPAAEEDYPPPMLVAYVPPPPSEPWPTALPEPTATPRPTLEEGRVVRGWGNFPRVPVVSVASDGQTLALYMVQGDMATQLVVFEGTHHYSHHIDVLPSPSGRYVACMLSWVDPPTVEVVDTQSPQRVVLHQATWDPSLSGGKSLGAYVDRPTSFAWLDDTHLMYTVGLWRDPEVPCGGDPPPSRPCPLPGELWMTDLNGVKQRLLAADRLSDVLGASPDGQQAYFLRLGAEWVPAGPSEWYNLYSLDLTSGLTATLWPQADDPARYTAYTLLPFPDGGQRVLFRYRQLGDTVAVSPPVIWMLDPGSGAGAAIWTIDQGKLSKHEMVYDTPWSYLWSPHSEQDWIYLADGAAFGGIWWVDLAAQRSRLLRQEGGDLLAWTSEGIVVYLRDSGQGESLLQLLGDDGQVQGEIELYP